MKINKYIKRISILLCIAMVINSLYVYDIGFAAASNNKVNTEISEEMKVEHVEVKNDKYMAGPVVYNYPSHNPLITQSVSINGHTYDNVVDVYSNTKTSNFTGEASNVIGQCILDSASHTAIYVSATGASNGSGITIPYRLVVADYTGSVESLSGNALVFDYSEGYSSISSNGLKYQISANSVANDDGQVHYDGYAVDAQGKLITEIRQENQDIYYDPVFIGEEYNVVSVTEDVFHNSECKAARIIKIPNSLDSVEFDADYFSDCTSAAQIIVYDAIENKTQRYKSGTNPATAAGDVNDYGVLVD